MTKLTKRCALHRLAFFPQKAHQTYQACCHRSGLGEREPLLPLIFISDPFLATAALKQGVALKAPAWFYYGDSLSDARAGS
jgi:hypothetical protein